MCVQMLCFHLPAEQWNSLFTAFIQTLYWGKVVVTQVTHNFLNERKKNKQTIETLSESEETINPNFLDWCIIGLLDCLHFHDVISD